MSLYVVGNRLQSLAQRYAHRLGCGLLLYESSSFADTESLLSFDKHQSIAGYDVVFIFNIKRTEPTNAQLFELLKVTTYLRMQGVGSIVAYLPYLPYSRQTATVENSPAGLPLIHSLFAAVGINQIISADIHEPAFRVAGVPPAHEISCADWWVSVIQKQFKDDLAAKKICLVAPDKGFSSYTAMLAGRLGVSAATVTKQRTRKNHATAIALEGAVDNMHAIIIDDIVDTAQTATSACDLLLAHGATHVSACFTHPVLSSGGSDRLACSPIKHIFVANTLLEPEQHTPRITYLDIHSFLAEHIKKLLTTLLPKDA